MKSDNKAVTTETDCTVEINGDEIEYMRSLLGELKDIADKAGHKLLYHLISMAEMEASSLYNIQENDDDLG